MQARSNLFTCKGGDTIQILKTQEYLRKMGVDVDLSLKIDEDLSKYDIVHLFNLTRVQETYLQIKNAKIQNKPVIFSTIYWPTDELELEGQLGVRRIINKMVGVDKFEKIKIIAKYLKGERNIELRKILFNNYFNMQKEIIRRSDYFLPNSSLEMQAIEKKFGIKADNYNVVVNAIDASNINLIEEDKFNEYKDCVLCIGRIEPRKNQLNLVKALKDTDYKLVIVGKPAPNHMKYYELVKKNANSSTIFLDYLPNDKIYHLCSSAKVHILPSWYETPGLVSLEAGVCGCNVVVSNRGTTMDYFKDMAFYCEPNDLNSILNSVNKAYNRKKNNKLKNYILENYTWEKAAFQTLKGYKEIY